MSGRLPRPGRTGGLSPNRAKSPARSPSPGGSRGKSPSSQRGGSPSRNNQNRGKNKKPGERDEPDLQGPDGTSSTQNEPTEAYDACSGMDTSKLTELEIRRLMLHQLCSIAISLRRLANARTPDRISIYNSSCEPKGTLPCLF